MKKLGVPVAPVSALLEKRSYALMVFVGDQLLVAIADRIPKCLRGTDTLTRVESNTVARIGGDEFVVLLDGIRDRADASLVAERLQEAIAEPFRLQGHDVFTTASIGIAFNELECEKADHLLRDADKRQRGGKRGC